MKQGRQRVRCLRQTGGGRGGGRAPGAPKGPGGFRAAGEREQDVQLLKL